MLANGNKIRVTDLISMEDIAAWNTINPVIITAGTGVGKSYFVKNILYEYARKNKQKILMLIHRKPCVEQFQMEISNDGKDDVIDIMTYQKLESYEIHEKNLDLQKYIYIVCDEFHYFISDAGFNNTTDISFSKIMGNTNAVKIFMSATGENVEDYIKSEVKVDTMNYSIPFDWSFIDTLNFFHSDASLPEFAKAVIEKGEKAIFFIQQAEKAYKLYKEFRGYALFNCSKQNSYYRYVDSEAINQVLKDQMFHENMLITTSCMDAGINIIDPLVKYIFINIKDIGSLIQCIGRKRIQSDNDKVHIYIKVINNQQLGGMESNARHHLEMADYLKTHTTQELIDKYPRQYDKSMIIYDDKVAGKDVCTKKINNLMYRKKQLDMAEYHRMIDLGEYGYCKYLARRLGKYNEDTGKYDYISISGNYGLENYLATHVGQIMLQKKDRNELIITMDVRRNGILKKSRIILNAALEEDHIPYRIEEFETSRIIDGKKKKFKSAWRIVAHDWSVI